MRNQTKLICLGIVFMMSLVGIIVFAVFDDVEGPLIYQIDVSPQAPVAGDHFGVTIYCIDPSGVSASELHYTTDGQNWQIVEMRFFTCLCIAGGRWVSSFGPLSTNDSIQFFVRAFDDSVNANPSDTDTFTIPIET